MQKEQNKKIIIDVVTGIVILGVLVVGYFAFRKTSPTTTIPDIVVPSTETADQVVTVGMQVSGTVKDLKDLNNSVQQFAAVFGTQAFSNLQDFSAQVPPEPVGRANPFLPTDWKLSQKSK
jgi:uncharacterized membrane protein YeiB